MHTIRPLLSMRHFVAFSLAAIAGLALAQAARATVPQGYVETRLASGLGRPVALAATPDGRILIGEQYSGRIKVFKNGAVLATPFASLFPVYTNSNETGLLGLAVDPAFATNGYVYAFVTETPTTQKVYRFTAQGDVGTSQTQIISYLPTRGINHDGGGIGFGPDGKLYVSVGDNGDRPNEAQSTSSLRGKLLRYEKDGTPAAGNPFGNAVYCYGLRNTFRFCFEPGTGRIFSTENGPTVDDEINILEAGKNYGWPNVSGIARSSGYQDPIAEFTPTIAPTGCTFYGGSAMPALRGSFFFGDYLEDKVIRVTFGAGGAPVLSDFLTNIPQPIEVIEWDGGLVVSTLAGSLVKVSAAAPPANQPPTASFAVSVASGPAPLQVAFDASGSADPDGTIQSHSWDFGDGLTGSGVRPAHTYALPGSYPARLTVTDDRGATASTTRAIAATSSGATPASAHVEAPASGATVTSTAVRFAGHGHASGQVTEHRWDYGDGSPEFHVHNPGRDVNSTPLHTYSRNGTYSVSLTVEDDQGQTDKHTIQITVAAPTAGPATLAEWTGQRFEWRRWSITRALGTYGQYDIALTAGVRYEISTSNVVAGTSDDPYLYLRSPGNRLVAEDDDSGGGRDAKIVYTPPASGTYKIRLRAYERGRRGTCTLTVRQPSAPPATPDPELRPGDVLNAQAFEWRSAFQGRTDGTYGQYKVQMTAGRTYTFETSNASGGDEDTYLYLLDSNLAVVREDDDGAGRGYLSRLAFTPPADGVYYLRLRAYGQGDSGTCTLSLTASGGGGGGGTGNPLLPDLITWVSGSYLKDAYIVTESGRKRLRFSNAVANRGAGPLELYGVVNATTGRTDAYQVVHNDDGSKTTHLAGTFSFASHATHNHWHFDEFAVYELRDAATNALIATSDKVSFCLLDFYPYTAETIAGAPGSGVYDCSNQGISKGWADVYSGGLDGQWIDITGVADGTYKLRSIVDPNDRLHEEPNTNNAAEITISISGSQVTVR